MDEPRNCQQALNLRRCVLAAQCGSPVRARGVREGTALTCTVEVA